MNGDAWFGFLGPNDWFENKDRPIYHLVEETFVQSYAERYPNTIVWRTRDQ